MTIEDTVNTCRESGLKSWELVAFVQRLVSGHMSYSYFNSFDKPEAAFEKGMGYCWQQSGALNIILKRLGFDSSLVHSVRCRFPDVVREGVTIHIGVSGHVWCRVRIGDEEKDVCPGRITNEPGKVHFTTLGKVYEFRGPIVLFSYLGSAMVNRRRGRRFLKAKAQLETNKQSKSVSIPVFHVVDVTAREIRGFGLKKAVLLGTKYTMEQDFYKDRLAMCGVEAVIPGSDDREFINSVIYNELCLGIVSEKSKTKYLNIIGNLADSSTSLILGCTKLGRLISREDTDIPLFDTAVIHAEKAALYSTGIYEY
jgi:hypothetical protein